MTAIFPACRLPTEHLLTQGDERLFCCSCQMGPSGISVFNKNLTRKRSGPTEWCPENSCLPWGQGWEWRGIPYLKSLDFEKNLV